MRLLNVSTHLLEEFFEPKVPPYIILSHRWDDDEVLFSDIGTANYKYKDGFSKIYLVCAEAIKADILYVWIDTCCIDKSSSAELSEAINSMYMWYRNSHFCYAYLSDIKLASGQEDITKSVWFDRGWTLQELIAPNIVKFYDHYGTLVGSRDQLSFQISQKTRIHEKMLSGLLDSHRVLTEFTVAQKMSWAAGRKTTRVEDRAYSLLGIFDVSMPLLYGEGTRAFVRLQEEILKTGLDLSILSWLWGNDEWSNPRTALLAESPDDFYDCDDIVKSFPAPGLAFEDTSFAMTNQGLQIKRPSIVALPAADGEVKYALSLNCRKSTDMSGVLALKIRVTGSADVGQASTATKKKVCDVGWLSDKTELDVRLIRVMFFEPILMSDWSTVTISKQKTKLQAQVHSEVSAYPHKYLWLDLPTEDPWAKWEFSDHAGSRWDIHTRSCRLDWDVDGWQYTKILLTSTLEEVFVLYMKLNINFSTSLFTISRHVYSEFQPGDKSIRKDFHFEDMKICRLSPTCRIRIVPRQCNRIGQTIHQIQIHIDRPDPIDLNPPFEVAGFDVSRNYYGIRGPEDPTYSYFNTALDRYRPRLRGRYRTGADHIRAINPVPQELDCEKASPNNAASGPEKLYDWRTRECIQDYVRTVLVSLDLSRTKAQFHGYVGVSKRATQLTGSEIVALENATLEKDIKVNYDSHITNLDELWLSSIESDSDRS